MSKAGLLKLPSGHACRVRQILLSRSFSSSGHKYSQLLSDLTVTWHPPGATLNQSASPPLIWVIVNYNSAGLTKAVWSRWGWCWASILTLISSFSARRQEEFWGGVGLPPKSPEVIYNMASLQNIQINLNQCFLNCVLQTVAAPCKTVRE